MPNEREGNANSHEIDFETWKYIWLQGKAHAFGDLVKIIFILFRNIRKEIAVHSKRIFKCINQRAFLMSVY